MSWDGRIPVLLTVEEAGELLRIGRTKAYAMAREWRETDGQSGLPVIDLGHVLRVPRQALEKLIGADLSTVVNEDQEPPGKAGGPARRLGHDTLQPSEPTRVKGNRRSQRSRRERNRIDDQLDLFESDTDLA